MRVQRKVHLLVVLAVGLTAGGSAWAEYATFRGVPVTQGQMRVAETEHEGGGGGSPASPGDQFVLKETRVTAEIAGVLARVRVEQVFQNSYPERLEAVYVFPLPEDAAVDGYSFQIGAQLIGGIVKRREEARSEYENAKGQGRKASLLEQERDNIFTQSIANIPPGETVTVHIEYAHPVGIDGDHYVFRFPMVVGPRYIPGQPLGQPSVGRGWHRDTDQVPDASRITPAPLPPGVRNGNDVSIEVTLDAGMPIQAITGVTHELETTSVSPTKSQIRLKSRQTIPDKDFVVEYRLANDEPVLASLAHRGERGGYFALVLQPKWNVTTAEITPREVVFLLDTSGSMQGPSISQLRILAGHLLGSLNPQDHFRVVEFNSRHQAFRADAVPATPENVSAAQQFVRSLQARGGTEMLPALEAALRSGGTEQGRPRHLVLVTDALVGNDDAILGYLKSPDLADVRVFPIAMGAAPNDYLIHRAAELGRGFALQVTNQDNAAEIAKRFREKTSAPYMTDLEIDWGGLAVQDVLPSPLPDLYAGKPVVVMGRYEQPARAKITLKGNILGQGVQATSEFELPEKESAHDSLAAIWARQRVRHIWNRDLGRETSAGRDEIVQLGLTHQLVTRYTSFVAVETQVPATLAGNLRTELVSPMLPEGMTEAASGHFATPPGRSAGSAAPRPTLSQPGNVSGSQPAPAAGDSPSSGNFWSAPGAGGGSGGGSGGSGSGGGGSVEWLFLGGLGLLAGGRLASRPRPDAAGGGLV